MKKFTTSLMLMLLMCIGQSLYAQYVNFIVSSVNQNGGTIGSAIKGQFLRFTYIIVNTTATNITNGTVICKIPAGTEYMPGTTMLRVAPIADANGKMPFTVPGGANIGTLIPNAQVEINFTVRVTASTGTISNSAIFKGTQNTVNIYKESSGGNTTVLTEGNDGRLYASNPFLAVSGTYTLFKEIQTSTGATSTVYTGNTGPCYDAISGNQLPNGSLARNVEAMAYDLIRSRLFFVNNTPGSNLGFINLYGSPVNAQTFGDSNYILSSTSSINRMGFSSAGDAYAITADNSDLIKINTGALLPVITHLGALQNDPINGSYNVLTETSGDVFGDGNGNLYLIGISKNLYRINTSTRVSTYLGTITGLPDIIDIGGAGFDANGDYLYISVIMTNPIPLASRNRVYKVDIATLTASTYFGYGGTNTFADLGSGSFPILSSPLTATQSWRDTANNLGFIIAGDPIEVTINVTNTGNIAAPGVKVYNPIPTDVSYIPNTTTLNGVAVADINGAMPFSIPGGTFINTVKPGDANKAVVKFLIRTLPRSNTCNRPVVIYPAIDRTIDTVYAETTLKANGTQIDPCFYSEGSICGCGRVMLDGSLNDYQSNLNWSIESDNNIDYHELEYSADNIHFYKLAKINAGNEKSFTDAIHTNFGVKNYRLKTVEINGRISYSNTVHLDLKGVAQVNPNPFTDKVNLRVELASAEKVIVRLMDLNGKVVYTTTKQLNAGGNNLQLPVNLAPGVYLSEIYAGSTRILRKKLVRL